MFSASDMALAEQGAEELKRFSVRMSAMLKFGELLEKLGPVQRAITDAETRLDALRQEEEKCNAAVLAARTLVEESESVAARHAASGREQASAFMQKARRDAEVLLSEARAAAKAIADDGNAQRTRVDADIAEARQLLENIRAESVAVTAERDRVLSAIEEMKARFSAPV